MKSSWRRPLKGKDYFEALATGLLFVFISRWVLGEEEGFPSTAAFIIEGCMFAVLFLIARFFFGNAFKAKK